jgi:hypothetical protein
MRRETKPPQDRGKSTETNSGRNREGEGIKWAGNETAMDTEREITKERDRIILRKTVNAAT